jgi:salicylate hydroxylase
MLPYLGQGACQAIEDGAVLATALSAEPNDPSLGLARYERARRPRASGSCSPRASGVPATTSAPR